ncbi:MAG TPA: hemolysin III family protein [Gemmatimonadaceae bacterium]|nr:hemolysin III family protein [Gemmatimonadaceae bacterium]
MADRPQTLGEEIANSLTHGAGLLASLAALPVLVLAAAGRRDALQLVGGAIYGATLVLLYLASTLYHALPPSRAKSVLRVLDHSAIYLLIAGTYTPFTLGALRGAWGWALLATVWGLALLGIVAKCTLGFRFPRLSTVLYVAMGWLVLVAIQPLVANVSTVGLAWLFAGGVCYTGGVVFYATDGRLRFGHALWHLCVVAGSVCHFVAVLGHAAPRMG